MYFPGDEIFLVPERQVQERKAEGWQRRPRVLWPGQTWFRIIICFNVVVVVSVDVVGLRTERVSDEHHIGEGWLDDFDHLFFKLDHHK